MSHLRFECGATIPANGELRYPWEPEHRRAKDGRGRLCVSDTDSPDVMRPTLPSTDGRHGGGPAHCRFLCPAKRASGRKEIACIPEKGSIEDFGRGRRRYVIRCYPAEVAGPAPGGCPTPMPDGTCGCEALKSRGLPDK